MMLSSLIPLFAETSHTALFLQKVHPDPRSKVQEVLQVHSARFWSQLLFIYLDECFLVLRISFTLGLVVMR